MIFAHRKRRKATVWMVLSLGLLTSPAAALDVTLDKWHVGVFSYLNAQISPDHTHAGMGPNGLSLGETSILTRGNLTSRISLLSEHSLLPSYYREDQFKLERLAVRYEINQNHWTEFGKIHTPVNYWNDWFHHGRLFFPTVDRPIFFSQDFFAIHDIGLRFGGMLSLAGVQYDLFLGSVDDAMSDGHHMSDDHHMSHSHDAAPGGHGDQIFPDGIQSLNIALTYERNNWLFRMATYLNGIRRDSLSKRGHFVSVHVEDERLRGLTELAATFSPREPDGRDLRKVALYQYLGYKITDSVTPYLALDLVSDEKVQGATDTVSKVIAGISVMPAARVTLKTQLERHDMDSGAHNALIFQLCVGM